MRSGPTIRRGQSSGEHGTPWPFINAVENKFGLLDWDLAATDFNHKADWWITKEEDSLAVDWHDLGGGLLWLNPPFADITPWAKKCATEMVAGAEILLLVPASIGSNWYWDWVEPFAKIYSIGRLQFEGSKWPYPKDLILCHYNMSNWIEQMERWLWQNEVTGTSTTPVSASSAELQTAIKNVATRLGPKT